VNLSPRVRRIAAVLVVVFVLTTVWAAYYLYAETHPTGGGGTERTVATYTENSLGAFAAALRPSVLYNNSTEIYGGNVTLFTPITNWINASIDYALETNRVANVSLSDVFLVTLSTPVWSKTLFTGVNHTAPVTGALASLSLQYDVNVTAVVALAAAIDTQLDYQGGSYTLSLAPTISGTVDVAGVEQPIAAEPTLNFTFLGSLISPSGLQHTSSGSLVVSSPVPVSTGFSAAVPYLALVGAVGGLGSSVWVATRRDEGEPLLPLEELIRPYEEAVVETARPPKGVTATTVAKFGDLVKIADTLGKPILRPVGPDPSSGTFFVVDGLIAYSYQYPGTTPVSVEPEPVSKPAHPTVSDAPASPAGSPVNAELVRRLQRETLRLRSLSLDSATAIDARARVRRAMELIRAGEDEAALLEIKRLAYILGAAENRARRR
jgi:hypothetical protein